jgi:hypothetical protein
VPQQIIVHVLLAHQLHKAGEWVGDFFLVPAGDRAAVQIGDFLDANFHPWFSGGNDGYF